MIKLMVIKDGMRTEAELYVDGYGNLARKCIRILYPESRGITYDSQHDYWIVVLP